MPAGLPGTGTPPAAATPRSPFGKGLGLARLFGPTLVNGVATHVDPVYLARPEFSLKKLLRRSTLFIVFLPVFLPLLVAIIALSAACSILGVGRNGGFLSNVASQFVGFVLTSKLLGPKADVPVRDVRLRDSAGDEHLVRIRGDFVSGNINVGDDVTIEGFDRGGTLMFWRGQNHRVRSDIRVKIP